MDHRFELHTGQLREIAACFETRVLEGLAADGAELECLPTYVPIGRGSGAGRCVVVDLGGTRVRAAVAAVARDGAFRIEQGPAETVLPVRRGEPLPRDTYLDVQAGLVAALAPPPDLPLGYCFSYPARPLPDGDAELIRWTKEVFVPDTEGQRVGALLLEALAAHGVRCRAVRVVNDTVASLLAGVPAAAPGAAHVGLIVGTGTNMAAALPAAAILKLPRDLAWPGALPVNLESGNFRPPHLTRWDEAADAASDSPGAHRFEKAVSGVYLGRVLAAVAPDAEFDPESGSRGVVEAAAGALVLAAPAQALLRRSARLVAACLAGLARVLDPDGGSRTVAVTAEGSLFWGAPGYAPEVRRTLAEILIASGRPSLEMTISSARNANLLGAAIAALAPSDYR